MRNLEEIANEELVALYYSGDRSALNNLIKKNEKYLRMVADRLESSLEGFITTYDVEDEFHRPHCKDLFQVAQIGLAKAIMNGRYDSSKGKVLTYATPYIEGCIRSYIAENSTGYTMKKTAFYNIMNSENDDTVPFFRLSIYPDTEDDDYESPAVSEESLRQRTMSVEKTAYLRIMSERIYAVCQTLTSEERDALFYAYGLFGRPRLTKKSLALYLCKSEKTVAKIIKRAEVKVISKGAATGIRELHSLWKRLNRESRRHYDKPWIEIFEKERRNKQNSVDLSQIKSKLRKLTEFVEYAEMLDLLLKAKSSEPDKEKTG